MGKYCAVPNAIYNPGQKTYSLLVNERCRVQSSTNRTFSSYFFAAKASFWLSKCYVVLRRIYSKHGSCSVLYTFLGSRSRREASAVRVIEFLVRSHCCTLQLQNAATTQKLTPTKSHFHSFIYLIYSVIYVLLIF